jgi:hypothetical protein
VSPLALTVEPNPVVSGSGAVLSLGADGLSDDFIDGAGASWQCWNGTEWIATHQVIKNYGGGARTSKVEPGATTAVEAIGLPIPNSYPIHIPNVAPGTYRIEDRVVRPGGVDIVGFVVVEVVAGGS